MILLRVCLVALAAFAVAPCGRSQLRLLAYDEFNYVTGAALSGQNGGTGWSTAWVLDYTPGISLGVSGTGLSYAGLSTSGGSATWGPGGNLISEASRTLPLVNSGVVYLQFLGQFGATSGGGTPNLRLSASGLLTGGIGGNGGTYGSVVSILDTTLNSAANGSSSTSASLSALNFMVVRIDYAANETRLWTNPNLATFDYGNPSVSDATYIGLAPAFDRIAIYTRNPGTIDELAVYSAIPEPVAVASIAGAAALLCAARRGRGRQRASSIVPTP
jgi:hypothetical protein